MRKNIKAITFGLIILLSLLASSCVTYWGDGEVWIKVPQIRIIVAMDWDAVEGTWISENGPEKRRYLGTRNSWRGKYELWEYREWSSRNGTYKGYVHSHTGWNYTENAEFRRWWKYRWVQEKIYIRGELGSSSNRGSN